MMFRRISVGSLAFVLATAGWMPLDGQQLPRGPEIPLRPQFESHQPVSPVFEGWYRNPDGTYTLSFGYFNRNSEETLEIPLGPDNFIEPAEFDGHQPTTFLTEREQSYTGRGWGVFGIVVPESWTPDQDVVWTIRSYGRAYSVPGRIGRTAYRLTDVDNPMAIGSMPPSLRFDPEGPEGLGPYGLVAETGLTTAVGTPLPLTIWTADRWDAELRDMVPVQVRWFKHQGPVGATVTFADESVEVEGEGGQAMTTATFSAPGEYVLRVRAANFGARDSTLHDHCCWTNGYISVIVAP